MPRVRAPRLSTSPPLRRQHVLKDTQRENLTGVFQHHPGWLHPAEACHAVTPSNQPMGFHYGVLRWLAPPVMSVGYKSLGRLMVRGGTDGGIGLGPGFLGKGVSHAPPLGIILLALLGKVPKFKGLVPVILQKFSPRRMIFSRKKIVPNVPLLKDSR